MHHQHEDLTGNVLILKSQLRLFRMSSSGRIPRLHQILLTLHTSAGMAGLTRSRLLHREAQTRPFQDCSGPFRQSSTSCHIATTSERVRPSFFAPQSKLGRWVPRHLQLRPVPPGTPAWSGTPSRLGRASGCSSCTFRSSITTRHGLGYSRCGLVVQVVPDVDDGLASAAWRTAAPGGWNGRFVPSWSEQWPCPDFSA